MNDSSLYDMINGLADHAPEDLEQFAAALELLASHARQQAAVKRDPEGLADDTAWPPAQAVAEPSPAGAWNVKMVYEAWTTDAPADAPYQAHEAANRMRVGVAVIGALVGAGALAVDFRDKRWSDEFETNAAIVAETLAQIDG